MEDFKQRSDMISFVFQKDYPGNTTEMDWMEKES